MEGTSDATLAKMTGNSGALVGVQVDGKTPSVQACYREYNGGNRPGFWGFPNVVA